MEEFGLTLRQLDSDLRKEREVEAGVLVSNVERFSIAQERNIVPGDIIVEADRKPVKNIDDFKSIIESKKPGDALMIRVKGTNGNYRFVALSIPKETS